MKESYARADDGNAGYVRLGREKLDPLHRGQEVREAFNYTPSDPCVSERMPDDSVVEGWTATTEEFFKRLEALALDILEAIQIGLRLEGEQEGLFTKSHSLIGKGRNATTLR